MPKIIWNENYWLDRAEDARLMGGDLQNDDCRRIMHGIADCYEHLATLSKLFHEAARRPQQQLVK
jgi:hypothetical protein